MEKKSLTGVFSFFYGIMLLISCNNNIATDKAKIHSFNRVTTVNDNGVLFIDTLKINNIIYTRYTITDYDMSYDVVKITNNEDTIEFNKDELFVRDFVCDMNNDNKDDLNITYQTTKGFITYSYLYSVKNNKLSTIPDTLIHPHIDDY